MGKITKNTNLNIKQKRFCKAYIEDPLISGNGLKAYAKAYSYDLTKKGAVNTAKANASRLLTNANILKYMRDLLEQNGLNDQAVDRELLFLIQQNSNLSVKLGAIKEYNSLRQRTMEMLKVQEKVNLNTVIADLKKLSTAELQRMV